MSAPRKGRKKNSTRFIREREQPLLPKTGRNCSNSLAPHVISDTALVSPAVHALLDTETMDPSTYRPPSDRQSLGSASGTSNPEAPTLMSGTKNNKTFPRAGASSSARKSLKSGGHRVPTKTKRSLRLRQARTSIVKLPEENGTNLPEEERLAVLSMSSDGVLKALTAACKRSFGKTVVWQSTLRILNINFFPPPPNLTVEPTAYGLLSIVGICDICVGLSNPEVPLSITTAYVLDDRAVPGRGLQLILGNDFIKERLGGFLPRELLDPSPTYVYDTAAAQGLHTFDARSLAATRGSGYVSSQDLGMLGGSDQQSLDAFQPETGPFNLLPDFSDVNSSDYFNLGLDNHETSQTLGRIRAV